MWMLGFILHLCAQRHDIVFGHAALQERPDGLVQL